jgi:capsular polysaccharide biosynthesis protein
MEARVAQGMEKGQMGERFTLLDAARLPEKPVRPNIPLVLLMGMLVGIAAGVGMASVREYADQSAHTIEDLARATNLLVFAGIAEIITREDMVRKKQQRQKLLVAAGVIIVAGLLMFHFFIMDIDILWAKISRRLAL